MDVDKQITYWRNGSKEDWEVAMELVNSSRIRHGLFFAHLAIEKKLKAHVCRETEAVPPRSHNLLMLTQKTNLPVSDEQKQFIARFDRYQMEGRYPGAWTSTPNAETAVRELDVAKDFLTWLTKKF